MFEYTVDKEIKFSPALDLEHAKKETIQGSNCDNARITFPDGLVLEIDQSGPSKIIFKSNRELISNEDGTFKFKK